MDRLTLTDRTVDLDTGDVSTGERLRPMEVKVLKFLATHAGAVVTPDELLQGVWRYAPGVRTSTVTSTIYRLRKSIEPDPSAPAHLITVHGGVRLLAAQRVKRAPTNLSPRRDAFVGRSAELAALDATRARLVSVVGPSGIGKTRLVAEWAYAALARFDGGAWLVDAAGAAAPDVWMERIASLFRCEADELPTVLEGRGGDVLLVLDDVSAGDPGAADAVRSLLDVPNLTLVVTGHAPLGLTGEQRIVLGPLETPSVELLVARIREEDHGFVAEAHAEPLAGLAAALDGSPLALELAAPYAALLGPAQALETLRASGRLASRQLDRPDHHRSTEAMVAHTWSLLPAWARRALQQLAVFERTFSLDLANRLLALEPDLPPGAEAVTTLVARGLVRATGSGRFRLYDLVRSFVRSQRTDPVFEARMIDAYAALAAGMFEDGLRSDVPVPSIEELETWEALTVRVLRGEPSPAGAAIGVYAYIAALRADRRRLAETIATRLDGVALPPVCRARFRVAHTTWNHQLRPYPLSIALTEEVASELRQAGLPRAEAELRLGLAVFLALVGLVREAAAIQRESRPLLASLEPDVPQALAMVDAQVDGLVRWGTAEAVVAEERVLAFVSRVAGENSAWAAMNLADALWEAGSPDRAEQVLGPILTEAASKTSRFRALALWSTMLASRGRGREALALADEAVAGGRRHLRWTVVLEIFLRRIDVYLELGDLAGLEHDLGALLATAPSPTPPRAAFDIDFVRARLEAARGGPSADALLTELVARGRELGLLWWLPLEFLAQTRAVRGEWSAALETLEALPDPSRARAVRIRLEALRGLGRHDEAVRILGALSPARDGFGWVSTALAAARAEAGDTATAPGKPDDREPWSRLWLARIAVARGDPSEAARLLDGASHTTRPPLLVRAIDDLRQALNATPSPGPRP